MSKINLENLSEEEQNILAALLEKSRSKVIDVKVKAETKPVKKRGRPKKVVVSKEKPETQIAEIKVSSGMQIKKNKKGVAKKKKHIDAIVEEKEKGDGVPCRVEKLDVSGKRPNKFLDMVILEGKAEDAKIDKKIKRTVSVRTRKPSLLNDVECVKCEYLFDNVPAVFCKQEDGQYTFTCSECIEKLK